MKFVSCGSQTSLLRSALLAVKKALFLCPAEQFGLVYYDWRATMTALEGQMLH